MTFVKCQLDPGAFRPEYAHSTDAGIDLRTPVGFTVPAHGFYCVDTGVHMLIPDGYCGLLVSKSGLNVNRNLESTGLVDAGYTGSIRVKLYNHGEMDQVFNRGDKVSQIVILPAPCVCIIDGDVSGANTERKDGGFGSTGA